MERSQKHKIYSLKDKRLDSAIKELVGAGGDINNYDLYAQMITTALKLQGEHVDRGDLKILNTSLKELRWAFRVFRPYRHIRKVSIFGSARLPERDPAYKMAKRFGKLMSESNWMTITGASTGIMWAGHEGAGRAMSFGANIKLPFEQDVNRVIENDPKLIHFKYFFTRKLIFIKESDAICLFPGGFGTLDEGCEVLTLVQTGKSEPRPVVLVEPKKDYYWEGFLRFVKKYILARKMIDSADLNLIEMVRSAEEARNILVKFYSNYHSIRFVGDRLVIRLERVPDKMDLARLNRNFSDIITKGKIESSGPLAVEANETETHSLARLVLYFDRKNFSRLKQMIDTINTFQ